jgi:hypothetical protein
VQTTQTPAAEATAAPSRSSRSSATTQSLARHIAWYRALRRGRPVAGALLAVLLWWPAGFWGIGQWPHLPMRAADGDRLLLGALVAAATVALVARSAGIRLLVVLAYSAVAWLLDAPSRDTYLDERQVLAALLAIGAVTGLVIGARGHRGPRSVAVVLAVMAGLSPATWPHGPLLAVALALPFAAVTLKRVVTGLKGALWVLATWLVTSLLARALSYGWAVLRPGAHGDSLRDELTRVLSASGDFLRDQWWRYTEALLQDTLVWLVVGAVLGAVLLAGRSLLAATSGARRRSPVDSTPPPGS